MSWIHDYLTYLTWHKTDLVYIILLTACTGTLCTLVLTVMGKYRTTSQAGVMMVGIRITMLAYVVPVVYFLIVYRRTYKQFGNGFYVDSVFKMGKVMWIAFSILLVLWAGAILIQLIGLIKGQYKLHILRKGDIPADEDMEATVERLRREYHIWRKIGICRNDSIQVPVLTGLIKPVIVFPMREYSVKEQEIVITHELMHFKSRDHIRKILLEIVIILNAWNPMVYQLRNIHTRVIEFSCDERCSNEGRKFFTVKEYFNMILDDAVKMYEPPTMTMSTFGQEPSEIEGRIIYMKNKIYLRKITKMVMGVAVGVAMLGTSFASYAMGEGMASGQEFLYKNTMEWNESAGGFNDVGYNTMSVNDPANADIEEIMVDTSSATRAVKNVDWTITHNTRLVSSEEMYLTAGNKISFILDIAPSDRTIKVGIKDRNDTIYYGSVSGTCAKEITIPSTGYYRFCIQNDSGATVRAIGTYAY